MARILMDVGRELHENERHISRTMDRLSKSADTLILTRQHISASMALLERARARKWSMNVPILPRRTDTLHSQTSTS